MSAAPPRVVVLVEGTSDRCAVEALAQRRGRDLVAERVVVRAIDGATNIRRALDAEAARSPGARLTGLCDAGEERYFRHGLEHAGLGADLDRAGLEGLGFFVCVDDLEDELVRALGPPAVEEVIAARGEAVPWRIFRNQPAQRERPREVQLRRFLGTRSGRKAAYARALVEAMDLGCVPRPLDLLLAAV